MNFPRVPIVLLAALLLSTPLLAKDKKDNGPESSVSFIVLKDDSGKPIRNAAVIMHPVADGGKQAKTGFELKTDSDGKTHFDGVPYGALRIQVIAPGFQTYGQDYNIAQPLQQITIRLKRPQQQYSIYEKHDGGNHPTPENPDTSNNPPQR